MTRSKYSNAPYFSARLRKKLADARGCRGIFIEASSGYGKTTLVQEFLLKNLPETTPRVVSRCIEESPQAAWRSLCLALQKIDAKTGKALLRLGPPDEDSTGDAGRLLRGMECAAPAWLVLDDFHHLAQYAPVSVWQALLEHDCPNLCVALVARPLPESVMPYEKPDLLRLDANDLRLTEQESREYFFKAGIALSEEEAGELHRRAEGWIFPLALHLRHYRDHKSFAPASDLDGQIREVIWNRLDAACQDFLLRLSPFEAFSSTQASWLLRLPEPPAALIAQLERAAHLRFDAACGLYYPHSAVLQCTRAAFAKLHASARREILQAAGDWCAVSGERKAAISFYYRLRDFAKILALDLAGLPDNRLLDLPDAAYADALRDIAAHCDREMKTRHPLSMLQLAFEFFGQGCYGDYGALCAEMAALVETAVPEKERDYLRGELLLLEAFSHYNSIAEMGERMKRASDLTGGKTTLTRPDNSWTFGNPSVLLMYHRDAGFLEAELADMESYTPVYTAMSQGHGSGGPALMRAEALLCRGKTKEAEIFGHMARHEAALRGQISIGVGAEFFFARLAILQGDEAAFCRAQNAIARLSEEYPQKSNRMEADMARSYLAGLLNRPEDAADWLRHGPPEAFNRRLFTQAIPFAHICRARLLLLDGQPEALLGESAAAFGLAAALNYALALIYGHIHAAAAWHLRGEDAQAASSLGKALDLALPDGLYLPFAEHGDTLLPMLEHLRGAFDTARMKDCIALCRRWRDGAAALRRALFRPSMLTPRQREIALLIRDGLSAREIAERLCLSEATVATVRKNIYSRLKINSKIELTKIKL